SGDLNELDYNLIDTLFNTLHPSGGGGGEVGGLPEVGTVPEPATLGLMALGLAALALRRRAGR
ncbi:MAG: PEP-CTERM sorting domain-containing protein, partial [Planctomycetes bacterium]|nr:PEP-CTERM sorting domain-containing protein [Planctomycetota bacterium]